MNKNKIRYAGIVLALCLLSSLFTYVAVRAVSPTSIFTLTSGIYPGAPSFTFWEEGAYTFIKDGNGLLNSSGTNASSLLWALLSGLHDSYVLIRKGSFLIDHVPIASCKNVTLFGEPGTVFYTTSDQYQLWITQSSNIRIEGIMFKGDGDTGKTQQTAITIFDRADRITITRCSFFDLGYDGVNLLWGASNCEISYNYAYNVGDDAFNPGGGGGTLGTNDTKIIGNTAINCIGNGVHLSINSTSNIVKDNYIYNCSEGIGIYNSQYNIIDSNIIIECISGIKCQSSTTAYQQISNNFINKTTGTGSSGIGICLAYTSNYSLVHGNTILNANNYAIWVLECQNTTISDNIIVNATQGIRQETSNYTFIQGNSIFGPVDYGIVVTSVGYNSSIVANAIRGYVVYYGIYLANSYSCCVSNVFDGKIGSWAIYEPAGIDYNRVTACDTYNCNYGIKLVGANSVCHASWNGTSWVS